ncbi:NADH dehydrogenase [ubiquinone] 1 subunit C1, mitochondrial [Acipenser oxyrinchus oxyrinchus]|uniref:NADH dehydrogenase [ubiquinone] 1 subunit C1, mitochondrial n=1 Tax=Acipenser oxyrinchus oxyrinchus TaxID=40147 RepID=A0AAD8GJG7_ACIOX|nr:NADH dehydrogenase [ubiquinone] 1 subunit C1, mitochondrial [Acipenser oxyrinchus oxyrinchus]
MTLNRLLLRSAFVSKTLTRSAFTARKPDNTTPNWLRVGLALGSTAALWALLFKQHSDDVQEYKTRHGLQ